MKTLKTVKFFFVSWKSKVFVSQERKTYNVCHCRTMMNYKGPKQIMLEANYEIHSEDYY